MSVLVAAGLDAGLGEPPRRAHPVVWMGSYLNRASQLVSASPPTRAALAGGATWLAGAATAAAAGLAVECTAARLPRLWRALARGTALWPLLSARLLFTEVAAVEDALRDGPDAGRLAAARIVSRDTTCLTPAEVRAAAVESLAENLSDSVVAPLCWYVVAGLPGAALYRFANTADAVWGYRCSRWHHAGRVAARADDALNLGPARLTAALLGGGVDWRRLRREAGRTPSPNAGWPMAALALRLDLRLAKPHSYVLNASGAAPEAGDIDRALHVIRRATAVAVAVAACATHIINYRPLGGRR